jgi:hypothetical protein
MNVYELIEMTKKTGMRFREIQKEFHSSYTDGVLLDQMLLLASLVAEEEFKKGFYAGWDESGEGFNADCGASHNRVYEMCIENWEERKKK